MRLCLALGELLCLTKTCISHLQNETAQLGASDFLLYSRLLGRLRLGGLRFKAKSEQKVNREREKERERAHFGLVELAPPL
jgi:hypothetical protein